MLKLIKNSKVIDPKNNINEFKDILIENSKIKAVEKPGTFDDLKIQEIIDAKGSYTTPGFIDIHVHFREPGFEWKETIKTGLKAAVAGGFTAVCPMPNTEPVIDNKELAEFINKKAKEANLAKLYPIASITKGLKGKELSPFSQLNDAGCIAFSDDGLPINSSNIMRKALEWLKMFDGVLTLHQEDLSLTKNASMNESSLAFKLGLSGLPTLAEDVMTARDIEIARITNSRIHICHIASKRSVLLVKRAKEDGIKVTAEVTPHHLTLSEDNLINFDTNYKMSPPLRSKDDIQGLIDGLNSGIIDCIATDHAPHDKDTKELEFEKASFGITGLQTAFSNSLQLVTENKISLERLVESLTSGTLNCFNLPTGGCLTPGTPADITIFNTEKEWEFNSETNFSKSSNSPFYNKKLKGVIEYTIVDGEIKFNNGKII